MTEYERGFIDGIKSKVSAELTPTLINVSKTMLEMLKPVLSTALENALNDNNAITNTDVQTVDRWISCKDKMPDDGVNVLIYTGNRMISLAWYNKDMGYFYICDSEYKYNSLDVTHWQPLPEPPKEE